MLCSLTHPACDSGVLADDGHQMAEQCLGPQQT